MRWRAYVKPVPCGYCWGWQVDAVSDTATPEELGELVREALVEHVESGCAA